MECLFNPQRIMQDFHHHDHDISNSCSSSSSSIKEEEEDNEEEVNSSSTPLQDMSSLLLQLPLKRGLSRHYNGKSQSFTSLTNVKCLEDLAKQENPFNKRLKTCKSYAGFPRKKPSNLGSHFSSNFDGGFLENNSNNSYYTNDNGSNMAPITPPQRSTSTSRLIY